MGHFMKFCRNRGLNIWFCRAGRGEFHGQDEEVIALKKIDLYPIFNFILKRILVMNGHSKNDLGELLVQK